MPNLIDDESHMKLYIMTDLEGVAGVINARDYIYQESRYYETARRLLTEEVNAAIEGFADGGFTDFFVVDGHGAGAINIDLLDPRARLSRGWGPVAYPFGMTCEFDAVAYVGQHAKAGTPFSHLTHTGSFHVLDQTLNDISIGEYGEGAFMAGELGVPVIFASGEKAFCDEAQSLTPWVQTVAVLEGVVADTGDELEAEAYERFHEAAVHLQPKRACEMIREGAARAARRFVDDRSSFKTLTIDPPYTLHRVNRPSDGKEGQHSKFEHPSSIIELFQSRVRQS